MSSSGRFPLKNTPVEKAGAYLFSPVEWQELS